MLKKIMAVALAAVVTIVAGCATGGGDGGAKVSRTLYVRGVFTWWDAEPEFEAKMLEPNLWTAKAELVADGNPYEWKFADGAWQAGTNFGYKKVGDYDGTINIGDKIEVNPNAAFENLKFTPPEDGVYQFYLDWRQEKPFVYIEKAQ